MAKSGGTQNSRVWSATSVLAGVAAAAMIKKGLHLTWKATTGKNPPDDVSDPDLALGEALAWAALSGVTIQVGRMLAARATATYYLKSTGHLPPGMGRDS